MPKFCKLNFPKIIHLSLVAITILSACSWNVSELLPLGNNSTDIAPSVPNPTELPRGEIVFKLTVPSSTPPGKSVFINILDEVTGLALNPVRYQMQQLDPQHFTISLPIPIGSVIKYRYTLDGSPPLLEHTTSGVAVRYRMYYAATPGWVDDLVSAWDRTGAPGPYGRITGIVVDPATTQPLANILVSIGGKQTITSYNGNFVIEELLPGTYNMVAYAMDGSVKTFQQGAVVAAHSSTPVGISMPKAKLVKVSFFVTPPQDHMKGIPIRLAGNIHQLGNTFADLSGGMNTIASRMPILTQLDDGRYLITIELPSGTDLRYKYTMGDGFWNGELYKDGSFRVRQLIIPETDLIVQDVIETWQTGNSAPVAFQVNVPAYTPSIDTISIQLNPYGWTEPLPMWSIGNNNWLFILYNPLHLLGNIGYRYCRNDQCGSADDSQTIGSSTQGYPFTTSLLNQFFQDVVNSWAWFSPATTPTTVIAPQITPRGQSFTAGIEFVPYSHPSWQSRYLAAEIKVAELGANWIFLTPTWTYTTQNPPVLAPVPGIDEYLPDVRTYINQARSMRLKAAIFPHVNINGDVNQWWLGAPRDFAWWQVWWERYETFILHHTELAAETGAEALIIGGEWINPALPDGILFDGSPSNTPQDTEIRWRTLIQKIRQRYNGKIIWAQSYDKSGITPPSFLDAIDGVYILWSAPIANANNPSTEELDTEIATRLERDILPIRNQSGKPIIIGINYPSADGSATACIPSKAGGCLAFKSLNRPSDDIPEVLLDLSEQAEIYNAFFVAINQRSWIDGIVSRGFYPPAALQDKSMSIHGKPAADILWFWFPKLLAPVP